MLHARYTPIRYSVRLYAYAPPGEASAPFAVIGHEAGRFAELPRGVSARRSTEEWRGREHHVRVLHPWRP